MWTVDGWRAGKRRAEGASGGQRGVSRSMCAWLWMTSSTGGSQIQSMPGDQTPPSVKVITLIFLFARGTGCCNPAASASGCGNPAVSISMPGVHTPPSWKVIDSVILEVGNVCCKPAALLALRLAVRVALCRNIWSRRCCFFRAAKRSCSSI